VGDWQDGVTTGQTIKVFMKFINDKSENPNKPAIATFRPERMLKFSSD